MFDNFMEDGRRHERRMKIVTPVVIFLVVAAVGVVLWAVYHYLKPLL